MSALEDEIEIENSAELEALEAEIIEDGSGFESGQSEQQRKKVFMGAKACGDLVASVLNFVARVSGDDVYKLLPEEKKEIGEALDPVAAKYLPAFLDKYGAEVSLAIAAMGIGGRMYSESNQSGKNGKA